MALLLITFFRTHRPILLYRHLGRSVRHANVFGIDSPTPTRLCTSPISGHSGLGRWHQQQQHSKPPQCGSRPGCFGTRPVAHPCWLHAPRPLGTGSEVNTTTHTSGSRLGGFGPGPRPTLCLRSAPGWPVVSLLASPPPSAPLSPPTRPTTRQPPFAAGLGKVPLPSLWVVSRAGGGSRLSAATADPLPRGNQRFSRLGGFGPGPWLAHTRGTPEEQ